MILGIGGKLSGGKTVTAVMLVKDDLEKGKKIISNIHLYGIPYEYMDSDALVNFIKANRENQKELERKFFNSTLLIDEIRNLISARKSTSNLNEMITQFLMMVGKLDCNVYYTYQVLGSMVDLQMREITTYFLECIRIDKEKGIPIFEEKRIQDREIMIHVTVNILKGETLFPVTSFVYEPKAFYPLYNTREMVILDREKYLSR